MRLALPAGRATSMAWSTIGRRLVSPRFEPHMSRLDAREVEEVVDDACLRERVALDDRETPLDECRLGTALEDVRPAENRIERCAQLVGDGPQEGIFGAVGLFRARQRLHQLTRARGHLAFEHLAVLVVIVAVGLQAQQVPHPHAQLGTIHGLAEKVLGSGAQPEHPGVAIVQGGDHDDGNVLGGEVALDRARHLVAVHARHHDVEQDQVGRLLAPPSRALPRRWRRSGAESLPAQHDFQQLSVVALVVHDQNARRVVGDVGTHRHLRSVMLVLFSDDRYHHRGRTASMRRTSTP